MERIGTVSSYFAIFAMLIIAVFVLLDAYECYSHGVFHGVIRIANIGLTSTGEIDLSVDVTANAWLQTRLHTVKIDAVDCLVHVDTPSGLHLHVFHTTTSLSSLAIQPKSLWSAWDGSIFGGHDDPIYSVDGRIAISHVNFINVGMMLTDTASVPSNNTHTLITECTIDGVLKLFSIPAMSVSMKKYTLSSHKSFSLNQPTTDTTDNQGTTSDHRSLNVINDIAFYLKPFLNKVPALASSLAMISQTDYKTLVNDLATSPSAIIDLVLSPLQNGQGSFSEHFDMAQMDFDYDLGIPPAYVPSFLMNVHVPSLAVRVSSGTPGSDWSWLVSTQPFIMDMSKTMSIAASVSCGDTSGSCTLMTPVFGFVSNAFSNLQDTFEFDMVGEDNVVYRALGRHTNISYSAMLEYQVPASNVVNDFGVISCLNVTLADRWGVKNACLKKQPGQPEVDVSFDIPSFDGTSGSYFGMSSAFTWTYVALKDPIAMPSSPPTIAAPSYSPTRVPTKTLVKTMPPTIPAGAPTMVPTMSAIQQITATQQLVGITLSALTSTQITGLKIALQQSIYITVATSLGTAAATGLNVTVTSLVQTSTSLRSLLSPTVTAAYTVIVNNPSAAASAAALTTAVSSPAALASIVSNVGSTTGVAITAPVPVVVIASPTVLSTAAVAPTTSNLGMNQDAVPPSLPLTDDGHSNEPPLGTLCFLNNLALVSLLTFVLLFLQLLHLSATVFTTFGGDIHIRGKQGQPALNSLVNLALQVAGENALPKVPRSLPLELGSAFHDGSFKYDLSTLLRTGEANFTRNAIVDGNQLLGPVLGLFQALYYLGKASTHIDEESPAYLHGDGGAATFAMLNGPQGVTADTHERENGFIADAYNIKNHRLVSQPQLLASTQV